MSFLQQPALPGQDNNCALLSYLALTKGQDIQGNTGLYGYVIVSIEEEAFLFVFNVYLQKELLVVVVLCFETKSTKRTL